MPLRSTATAPAMEPEPAPAPAGAGGSGAESREQALVFRLGWRQTMTGRVGKQIMGGKSWEPTVRQSGKQNASRAEDFRYILT